MCYSDDCTTVTQGKYTTRTTVAKETAKDMTTSSCRVQPYTFQRMGGTQNNDSKFASILHM